MSEKLRISLRVVFYRESDLWVAHCLEMDIMGHDKKKEEAVSKLVSAIAMQIGDSILAGNYGNIFMPADAKFFEMFAAGRDVAKGQLTIEAETVQEMINPKDDVTIHDVDAREYRGLALV